MKISIGLSIFRVISLRLIISLLIFFSVQLGVNAQMGPNLVVNGDFESGGANPNSMINFNSDYSYYPMPSVLMPGNISVLNNANLANGLWVQSGVGGSGNFLACDGSVTSSDRVWYQLNISVIPNRDYYYSFYLNNIVGNGFTGPDPCLNFKINNTIVDTCGAIEEIPDQWVQFSGVWFSGADTTADLEMILSSINSIGNDIGIDSIEFRLMNCDSIFTIDFAWSINCKQVSFINLSSALITGDTMGFYWDFGDGYTSTAVNPIHTYLNSGTYNISLSLTNLPGCLGTYSINLFITVDPKPVADFSCNPEIASLNFAQINFTDMSLNSAQWLWDFGDSSTATSQHTSHTYKHVGYFQIWLYISSQSGCSDSTMHEILIINDSLVFPNIITPNNDGKNDYFVISNLENYPENTIVIFNRWGKKIFEHIDYKNDWNGENHPDGVYYYILKYRGYNGGNFHKGSITIMR